MSAISTLSASRVLAVTAALFAVYPDAGAAELRPQGAICICQAVAVARLAEEEVAGLEVTVKPTRTSDSLVINGDIVNAAKVTREVPRLRVILRNGNKAELDATVLDPPVARLAPGETAHFGTTFEYPSLAATGVAVTFVAR